MKLRHLAVAAFVLAAVPQAVHAQAARITPALSTTMQRVCDAETTARVLMDGGKEELGAQPSVARQTRGLRVLRDRNGLVFEQTATDDWGDTLLRFVITPTGAVSGAELSGSAMDAYAAATPDADLPGLAAALAEDVPERLMVGRTLSVGDSYYPESLRRSLIGRVISGMGLPFAVNGSLDIFYRGEVVHEGRRAWRFTGQMAISGAGTIDGRPVAIAQAMDVEILHDAETALVLSYSTKADTRVDLDGRPTRRVRNTEAYTCRIVPQ